MSTQQPGWYTDPLGHADRRWFDGSSWTANVLDADGREGIDQLPGPAAPAATVQPGAIPPPPGAAANHTWAGPAGGGTWSDSAWQAPDRSLPAKVAHTAVQPVAQPGGWPPQPAVAARSTRGPNPIVIGLVALAAVCFVLSLFVLDWVSSGPSSAGFGDLVADGASPDAFLDKLSVWHFQWLGYVVAAVAIVAVAVFVLGRAGSTRAGHVGAAAVAGIGALLATLAIVRYFRFPGLDPELGAWLLPAGYLVLAAAAVVGARTSTDR